MRPSGFNMETKKIEYLIGIPNGIDPGEFWVWEEHADINKAREHFLTLKGQAPMRPFKILKQTTIIKSEFVEI